MSDCKVTESCVYHSVWYSADYDVKLQDYCSSEVIHVYTHVDTFVIAFTYLTCALLLSAQHRLHRLFCINLYQQRGNTRLHTCRHFCHCLHLLDLCLAANVV